MLIGTRQENMVSLDWNEVGGGHYFVSRISRGADKRESKEESRSPGRMQKWTDKQPR